MEPAGLSRTAAFGYADFRSFVDSFREAAPDLARAA